MSFSLIQNLVKLVELHRPSHPTNSLPQTATLQFEHGGFVLM